MQRVQTPTSSGPKRLLAKVVAEGIQSLEGGGLDDPI